MLSSWGHVPHDQLAWLRDDKRSNPAVLAYLRDENEHTQAVMADCEQVIDQLCEEMDSHVPHTERSPPWAHGECVYWRQRRPGQQYWQWCRKRATAGSATQVSTSPATAPTGRGSDSVGGSDSVYGWPGWPSLDLNGGEVAFDENQAAEGHNYWDAGHVEVSPDGRLVAYTADTTGAECYTLTVSRAASQQTLMVSLHSKAGQQLDARFVWGADSACLYIALQDHGLKQLVQLRWRDGTARLHAVREVPASSQIKLSSCRRHLIAYSKAEVHTTTLGELDSALNLASWQCLHLGPDHDCLRADVWRDHLIMLADSDEHPDGELLAAPLGAQRGLEDTMVLVPGAPRVQLLDFCIAGNHLALLCQQDVQHMVMLYQLPDSGSHLQQLQGSLACAPWDCTSCLGLCLSSSDSHNAHTSQHHYQQQSTSHDSPHDVQYACQQSFSSVHTCHDDASLSAGVNSQHAGQLAHTACSPQQSIMAHSQPADGCKHDASWQHSSSDAQFFRIHQMSTSCWCLQPPYTCYASVQLDHAAWPQDAGCVRVCCSTLVDPMKVVDVRCGRKEQTITYLLAEHGSQEFDDRLSGPVITYGQLQTMLLRLCTGHEICCNLVPTNNPIDVHALLTHAMDNCCFTAPGVQVEEVVGSFDASSYHSTTVWAASHDGERVPVTVAYRRDLVLGDGNNPAVLHGYGAYGSRQTPSFNPLDLPLLDRGFVLAIAHVRGGGELGAVWHRQGKRMMKMNTFHDFMAAARLLIQLRYTSAGRLAAWGRSAGGLTVAASINMEPTLFAAALLDVPFLDPLGSMCDPQLPRTRLERSEWGDPLSSKEVYEYISSYSPYGNLPCDASQAVQFPHMLLTAGLHDQRVAYWEPAKYCTKLRRLLAAACTPTLESLPAAGEPPNLPQHPHTKATTQPSPGSPQLLLHTNMSAGHFSGSGASSRLRERAVKYAFLLKTLRCLQLAQQ